MEHDLSQEEQKQKNVEKCTSASKVINRMNYDEQKYNKDQNC